MSKASKNRQVTNVCKVFRVLSDETRLRLVLNLQEGEQHVSQLCRKLRLPQPTVSHHLGLLRIHDLVRARRDGKQVFYSINSPVYDKAVETLTSLLG